MKKFVSRAWQIYQPYRWAILGTFAFIACSQAVNLTAPYLQGRVVDSLINQRPINQVYILVLATLVMSLLQVAIMYMRERNEIERFDFDVPRHVSHTTLETILGFSISQHINENSGIKQSVINRGQHSLTALAMQTVYGIGPMAIEVLLLIGILLYFSVIIGMIALVGLSAYVWMIISINQRFQKKFEELEKKHTEHSKLQNEVMRNVELVLSHAQEEKAAKECDLNYGELSDFGQKMYLEFNHFAALRNSMVGIIRFSILASGVFLVYQGSYSVGQLVMFYSWASQALGQVSNVGYMHRQLIQLYTSVQKYFNMLDIEPDVKVLPNPVRPDHFQGRIEFKNVTIRYKRRDKTGDESDQAIEGSEPEPALRNVNFVIEPGETVAFVGESGAGKSTAVHALMRAQDPDEGQIIVDDNDLRLLDLKYFRESIGIVDQDVSLFDQTLRYNITFGLNGKGSLITDSELDRVAEMSCINRFFSRLEKGYDTYIGERGIKLSGGEKQRVGIARALIKNPDILIFDEATSSLDAENEALIRESIERAAIGRTTIIIAHRFSTIRKVDKVVVFQRGEIVGVGTHEELAQTCEAYQRLIRNQVF